MATTSTVPTVKAALVTALQSDSTLTQVDVSYGFRPWGLSDQIFLADVEGVSEIPTMKAGRKYRQETYTVEVVCRTFDPGGTAHTVAATEARAFVLLAAVENVLADDVQIDGTSTIQNAWVEDFSSRCAPHDKGWVCELVASVRVNARLT